MHPQITSRACITAGKAAESHSISKYKSLDCSKNKQSLKSHALEPLGIFKSTSDKKTAIESPFLGGRPFWKIVLNSFENQ